MARSRTYVRDANGRFASTGGGGKGIKRGRTELIRARRSVRQARGKLAAFDPADQSNKSALSKRAQRGAVTRAEKRLAAVRKTAVIKGARVSGTISKNRRQRPAAAPVATPAPAPAKGTAPKRIRAARPAGTISKKRQPVMRTTPMGNNRVPASQRPGSVTRTLRETLRTLAAADAKRIRELEAITGQKLTVPQGSMSRKAKPQSGSVAGALRETLRTLAQSDARMARETDAILREATRKLPGGKGGGGSKRVKGGASGKALPGAAAPAPAKPKRSRGGGQAAAKPAAAPAGPKRSGRGKRAKSLDPATEAKRIRDAIASINAGSDARRRAYGESNGLLPNATGPMAKRAAGLERIAAADRAAKAKAEQDAKKLAKAARATGQGNKDSNRLRTLNRRLAYYRKQGLTPDERAVERTRAARNQLASDMIARGGTSVKVRSKTQAAKAYRARTNALGSSVGGKRQVFSRQRIPQLNIWGRVEMTGAGKFRQIGKRAGTGKVIRSQRTARPLPGTRSFQREMDRLASARAAVLAQSRR